MFKSPRMITNRGEWEEGELGSPVLNKQMTNGDMVDGSKKMERG